MRISPGYNSPMMFKDSKRIEPNDVNFKTSQSRFRVQKRACPKCLRACEGPKQHVFPLFFEMTLLILFWCPFGTPKTSLVSLWLDRQPGSLAWENATTNSRTRARQRHSAFFLQQIGSWKYWPNH